MIPVRQGSERTYVDGPFRLRKVNELLAFCDDSLVCFSKAGVLSTWHTALITIIIIIIIIIINVSLKYITNVTERVKVYES